MLDELTRIDAVERLEDQRVRAKSRIPILTGMTAGAIAIIGERTRDLLDTLTNNLRRTSKPLFEGTALADEIDLEMISLFRRELAEQGASFLNGANSLFGRSSVKTKRSTPKTSTKYRLGVTVYYFQDDIEGASESQPEKTYQRRKNLSRQRRQTNKGTASVNGRSVAKNQP
jgi:hypothetical protein